MITGCSRLRSERARWAEVIQPVKMGKLSSAHNSNSYSDSSPPLATYLDLVGKGFFERHPPVGSRLFYLSKTDGHSASRPTRSAGFFSSARYPNNGSTVQ